MEGTPESIDRAQWGRYRATGDRCEVCGSHAEVTINLSARENTGTKGGALVQDKFSFCNEHALLRYGCGKRAITTGSAQERR